jgi:predicted RNA-binding protein with PUA-like domain
VITLEELRSHERGALRGLRVLQRGNRLSITPIDPSHWRFILSLV